MKHKPFALAVSAVLFAAAFAVHNPARAQATPKAKIDAEDSTVIILDDRIVLKRVPVTFGNALNKTVLRDVTIQLGAKLSDGKINSVKIVSETKATALGVGFVAGKYKDVPNDCEYTVSGPSAGNGGRTNWSLSSTAGRCGNSTSALSGTWQTGSIAGHRNEVRLKEEVCPDADPSTAYGLWGGSGDRYNFTNGQLLRVVRSQNSIVVEEVGHDFDVVCATTAGPITLTFCPSGICPAVQ
ncbi:MAG: hypothetical protein ACT4PZ_24650 [Panacagrimonas sp.]